MIYLSVLILNLEVLSNYKHFYKNHLKTIYPQA